MRPRSILTSTVAALAVVALSACGSSPKSAAGDDDVASLGTTADAADDSAASSPDDSTANSVDPEDAFNSYTECMRDEGIDMPDAQVITADASGGASPGQQVHVATEDSGPNEGAPDFDPESEEFQAAQDVCQPILDDAMGEIDIDPEVLAEQRENMLAFAQCMRDQGLDFPDPKFGENGSVSISMGSEEGDGGPRPDDTEFQAANEACQDLLGDGAFSVGGAAPGGGPAGGSIGPGGGSYSDSDG